MTKGCIIAVWRARFWLLTLLLIAVTGMSPACGQYRVRTYGSNFDPLLRAGYSLNLSPAGVIGVTNAVRIAAGNNNAMAIAKDGTVWMWGGNACGNLGDGTYNDSFLPIRVAGLTHAVAGAIGYWHSLALKDDGTVWAWGQNNYGQLGDGTNNTSLVPVMVTGLTNVIGIGASFNSCAALKSDGTVWTWGQNNYGQLGDGTTTDRSAPVQVVGLTNIIALSSGQFANCAALRSDGTVREWGYNGSGELGNGTFTNSSIPVQVTGLTGVTAIASGSEHSLALKTDGTVWTWGRNNSGQLGNGMTSNTALAAPVPGLTGMTAVAGGTYHSMALKDDGTVWAWGQNFKEELGNGTVTNSATPVLMQHTGHVRTITANSNSYVLADDPDPDFNGDGVHDLMWQNTLTGELSATYLTNILPTAASFMFQSLWFGDYDLIGQGAATSWKVAATTDLNGDGKTDIVWRNSQTGDITYWLMDGKSVASTGFIAHTVPTAWKIVAAGDFNGDGKADLVWENATTGDAVVWYMDGVVWTGNWDYLAGNIPTDWQIVGSGAFGGGSGNLHQADLVWRNRRTGDVTIWYMNGPTWTGDYAPVASGIPLDWTISGVMDLNNDLSPDLIWHNTKTGDVSVWYMNGAYWTGAWDYLARNIPLEWTPTPTH